jgi:hypothetical protein
MTIIFKKPRRLISGMTKVATYILMFLVGAFIGWAVSLL